MVRRMNGMPALYGFLMHFLHFKPEEIHELSDMQIDFYSKALSEVLKAKYGSNERDSNSTVKSNNNRIEGRHKSNIREDKVINLDDNGQKMLESFERNKAMGKKTKLSDFAAFVTAYF